MNQNYQIKLDSLLNSLTYRPKLLLHSCCGPCSSYVTEYLTKYFDIWIYYYNPNIYPESEYIHRLETQQQFLKITNYGIITDSEYNHRIFTDAIKGYEKEPEGGKRCDLCFRLRLESTAKKASNEKFDFFGTTLTVSPHKNAQLLNQIGEELAEKYKIRWLYSDFKKREGYKRSIELSREYDLYRQNYCGCEFSLNEKIKSENEQKTEIE